MPNDKKQSDRLKQLLQSYTGDKLSPELRQLVDLAVRKQLSGQEVIQRFVNTQYFRRSYPGVLEKNGTISNALTGQQGVEVSAQSLAGAIKNYNTALNDFGQIAKTYGYKNFGKDQLAKAIENQTSAQEFGARLQAVETVNSNPALKDAYEAQLRANGIKVTPHSAFRAAIGAGDKKEMNIYEGAQYQYQLGLSRAEAADLAKGKAIPAGATFEDVSQIVNYARQNLQQLQPELAAQGINAARLVKALGNPGAYAAEIQKIKDLAVQRQALSGRAVPGSYAQQGAGGGLSTYGQQGEASY